jgi:hypothetical protein
MATYTIEINERTNKGKALRTFLECEEVVILKPLIPGDELLLNEIATGLLEVRKIREGKIPKKTVAQMLSRK